MDTGRGGGVERFVTMQSDSHGDGERSESSLQCCVAAERGIDGCTGGGGV